MEWPRAIRGVTGRTVTPAKSKVRAAALAGLGRVPVQRPVAAPVLRAAPVVVQAGAAERAVVVANRCHRYR